MQIGLMLHQDRGTAAVLEEARRADEQGYHAVWMGDHLMATAGEHKPDQPFDCVTLMAAVAAVTSRVRLCWGMLNMGFRAPAVLAKTLATIDHISKGRVVCTLGAGWYEEEHRAYGVPIIKDHDARIAHNRAMARLFKELWTHPAPEKVSFSEAGVEVSDLPFNPAPVQKPHPPIWLGGNSPATLAATKEVADGWVMLSSVGLSRLAELRAAPDWPKRRFDVSCLARIHVAASRDAALAEAEAVFRRGGRYLPATFEEFLSGWGVVGTPDECLARIAEFAAAGVTHIRVDCTDAAHQERVARHLLPRLSTLA